jgi:integrase
MTQSRFGGCDLSPLWEGTPVWPRASQAAIGCQAKRWPICIVGHAEARVLIDSIEVTMIAGLRDRALIEPIALMVYSFARIGAALGMKVEDVFTQNRRLWVRLREKGGKSHAMPCHHNLEAYITAYIDGAGLTEDPKGPLFRTIGRGKGRPLTRTALQQAEAYLMIARRAAAAGIATKLGNHSFRAIGITAYLKNAARWRRRRRWRTRSRRAARSYMTVGARNSASTRWRGSGSSRSALSILEPSATRLKRPARLLGP